MSFRYFNPFEFCVAVILLSICTLEGSRDCSDDDHVNVRSVPYSRMADPLVVNGIDAEVNEFPWLASLQYYNNSRVWPWVHTCGAALIDYEWAMTAAHCLGSQELIWRLAFGKINLAIDEPGQLFIVPTGFFPHPRYKRQLNTTWNFDIGLVRLSEEKQFTKQRYSHIRPVELPKTSDIGKFQGKTCVTAGWGQTGSDGNAYSAMLQKIQVTVIQQPRCIIWFKQVNMALKGTQMCSLPVENANIANGDSGGPLVCVIGERFIITGVISHGLSSNVAVPILYVRVTAFRKWINEVRMMNGFEPPQYKKPKGG